MLPTSNNSIFVGAIARRKRQPAHNDLQIMSTNIETFERTVATQQPLSVEQNSKEVWHMGRSAKVVTKIEHSLGRLGHMRRRRRGIYVDTTTTVPSKLSPETNRTQIIDVEIATFRFWSMARNVIRRLQLFNRKRPHHPVVFPKLKSLNSRLSGISFRHL